MLSHSLCTHAVYLVFFPQRFVFFLFPFYFPTEDGFPLLLKSSYLAVSFRWSRSTPHHPIFARASRLFTFFSSLFTQVLPQENCRPLLLTPEPGCAPLYLHWGRRETL